MSRGPQVRICVAPLGLVLLGTQTPGLTPGAMTLPPLRG